MTAATLGPATLIGTTEGGSDVWRGVQYALHPVYTRRLTPAVDYTHPVGTWRYDREPGGDRLAWLSIWRLAGATGPLPVVAWIGDRPGPLDGCVYVRVNIPTGAQGVFWQPEVSRHIGIAHSYALSALRWIKASIAAFGGDPGNVTLGGGKEALLVSEDPAARGLFHKAFFVDAGGDEIRWKAQDAANQMLRFRRAAAIAAPTLAAEQDRGPLAPHWYVDADRVLRDPQGYRRVVKGVQYAPSTLVLHDVREDYRYRTRFGSVTLHDGSTVAAGPGTGVSEPTYAVKLGWQSRAWTEAQIAAMAALGVNCVQVNVEPAMQFVPPYKDPIDGKLYPSEMEVLDHIIDTASSHGMAVQVRQANDRCADEHINDFMRFLIARYQGRSNIWLNPANEINCFEGGTVCGDPVQWAADMRGHLQAIRAAGWTAPVMICGTSYSGNVAAVLAQMDADPVFYNDPNLIFGLHHYKADADVDFETSRRAVTEDRWAPVLDSRYCAIVEESGVNNLGIVDLDPELNPPNPSSDPAEWADTALYFQQFLRWCGARVAEGGLHGFIAFNWGSWSGSRNRDNGLTRIGTDGGLTGWGQIYRDEWLDRDYAPLVATLAEALQHAPTGEAIRRWLADEHLIPAAGTARADLISAGVRVAFDTGVAAAAALAVPTVYAATLGTRHVAPANAMSTAHTAAPVWRRDAVVDGDLAEFALSDQLQ